jgi:hypothetical protein
VGQDGLPDDLVLLQGAQDIPVVGDAETLLLGDEGRDRAHLVPDFDEGHAGAVGQGLRGHVHAVVLEARAVELRGQAEVRARAGKDRALHELVVGRDLGLELGEGGLVARDLVLLEQLLDPVKIERRVAQVLLDLRARRAQERRLTQSLAHALLGEDGERCRARHVARVFLEADQGRRAPLRSDLVVEQGVQSAEDREGDVEVGQLVLAREGVAFDLVLRGLDEDVEVLAHQGVRLRGAAALQFGQGFLGGGLGALVAPGLEVQHLLVEPGDADLPRSFGGEAREGLQKDVGVGVALDDPGGTRRGRGRGGRRRLRGDEAARTEGDEGEGDEEAPHLSHFASQAATSR